jgi:hypothetical protein
MELNGGGENVKCKGRPSAKRAGNQQAKLVGVGWTEQLGRGAKARRRTFYVNSSINIACIRGNRSLKLLCEIINIVYGLQHYLLFFSLGIKEP